MCTPGRAVTRTRRRWTCIALASFVPLIYASAADAPVSPDGWMRGNVLKWDRSAPAPAQNLNYRALVIGVGRYRKFRRTRRWQNLVTAARDAEAIAGSLQNHFGFNVKTLLDEEATREAIVLALDELTELTIRDAALVYFSGHGYYDEDLKEGFWIPHDARRVAAGQRPKHEWIWNTSVTKILGASRARHILVVVDSCYAGSLFRGSSGLGEPRRLGWYARANARPSRYLITSGNLEPVSDAGGRHSVFAQQFLEFLNDAGHSVFAASEIAPAMRQRVGAMTGQMMRMGPLAVASHADGEFVFVRKGAALPETVPDVISVAVADAHGGLQRSIARSLREEAKTTRQVLQDAVLLNRQGAARSARAHLSGLAQEAGGRDALSELVAGYLSGEKRSTHEDGLKGLITRLEARKKLGLVPGGADDGGARPRILACIGPVGRDGGTDDTSLALLYRVCLAAELQASGGMHLVEREALETVLAEMDLGASQLSDERAGLTVGELLPASLVLFGHLRAGGGKQTIYLRLVDTESTKMLSTFWIDLEDGDDVLQVCRDLAGDIEAKVRKARPLIARAVGEEEGLLRAGVGRFHSASTGMVFELVERDRIDDGNLFNDRERKVGTARVVDLGETTSALLPRWAEGVESDDLSSIWIREAPPSARGPAE